MYSIQYTKKKTEEQGCTLAEQKNNKNKLMGVPDLFVSSFLPTFFICHVFISFFSIHFLLYFSPPCLSPSLIYVAILKNVNSGEETKQLSNNLTTATTIDRTHYLLWQILLFVHPCFCFLRDLAYIYIIYTDIFFLSGFQTPIRP